MASSKVSPTLILVFINIGIVLGMFFGYRNYNVDRLSLFAIGGLSLLVLNGMFFLIRKTEPDLPPSRLKQMNKWVVWPIVLLAGVIVLIELFSKGQ
jgi:predicted MFS family arabinose efflux permease